jgi:transcriptional accessory protein Tex/SPT6
MKINHPSEVLKKGDKVECIVMAIDKEKRRISLSMKYVVDDTWETLAEKCIDKSNPFSRLPCPRRPLNRRPIQARAHSALPP